MEKLEQPKTTNNYRKYITVFLTGLVTDVILTKIEATFLETFSDNTTIMGIATLLLLGTWAVSGLVAIDSLWTKCTEKPGIQDKKVLNRIIYSYLGGAILGFALTSQQIL